MSKVIRAKFKVSQITEHEDSTKTVKLVPVTNDSYENKGFWKWTPSGSIELNCTNPEAEFHFSEYYIDFIKVN